MTFGVAANVAVGAAGGGGGDGGMTVATFLLQAPSNKTPAITLANTKL